MIHSLDHLSKRFATERAIGIDPNSRSRRSRRVRGATKFFKVVRIKASGCNRAIMVTAPISITAMMAAAERASTVTVTASRRLAGGGTQTNRIVKGLPDRCGRQHPGALRVVRHRTHCCAVLKSTAGNVWAGRYLPPKRCNQSMLMTCNDSNLCRLFHASP